MLKTLRRVVRPLAAPTLFVASYTTSHSASPVRVAIDEVLAGNAKVADFGPLGISTGYTAMATVVLPGSFNPLHTGHMQAYQTLTLPRISHVTLTCSS